MDGWMEGWMDGLRFYGLSNIISEAVCNEAAFKVGKDFRLQWVSNGRPVL